MSERPPRFPKDLYRGTAADYDRFRPPYPDELVVALLARSPGRGRLLDLACGTGQVIKLLHNHFDEVIAVDQEVEAIEFGRTQMPWIEWHVGTAESVEIDGTFDLITIGNAFHRLDRRAVCQRVLNWLEPDGRVALIWSNGPDAGDAAWQSDLRRIIESWQRRLSEGLVPDNWEADLIQLPTEQLFMQEGLVFEERLEFPVHQTWTPESIAGYYYSTSILSRRVLGTHIETFEADLHALGPGPFVQRSTAALEIGRCDELVNR